MKDTIKSSILNDFKIYHSIKTSTDDKLYMLYIEKSMQSILNLTNRVIFPINLRYIVLDMMNDFYEETIAKTNVSSENGTYVKQIEEDGRSVTFGNMTELQIQAKLSSDINSRLEMRKKEIYRYKLLYREDANGKD